MKFLTDSGLRSQLNKINSLINRKTEGCKRSVILTQAEYDKLSDEERKRDDTLYFIKLEVN